jgi:chitodextrinase
MLAILVGLGRRVSASVFGNALGCVIGLALSLQSAIGATTPAFVQEKDNQVTSGKTVGATFSSPTTVGNLIVAYLIWDNPGTVSVSDSLGSTYVAAVGPTGWSNSKYSVQTFYAVNVIGGPDTVTVTFATSIRSFGILYAHEYSGIVQTAPIDGTAAAAGTSGPLNSGSATTTNNIDLLFAGGVSATVVTSPGIAYSSRSRFQGNMTEDRIVSATGSYTATANNSSGAWAIQMVAFKGAPSGISATTPPTVPANLSVTSTTSSTVSLSWTPSTDNVAVAGYKIYRGGVQVGTSGTSSFADTGLAPLTTYSYRVSAYDAAGNNSAQSSAVNAATLLAQDTTPPTVPTNLSVTGTTSSTVSLSWISSTDNVGVAGYRIYRGGVQVGTSSVAPYTDSGLAASTTHSYTVSAYDAAGNNSAQSANVGATTSSAGSGTTYTTTFPLTENPISEGGNWINGSTNGVHWSNVRTTSEFAFGTEPGTIDYDDSTAVLSGAWGQNQAAQGTIKIVSADATQFEEVELRLNTTVTQDSITGYEINCSVKPGNSYMQLVRWNGPLGNFTGLSGADVACANGDVIKATNIGGTITAYLNGVAQFSWTDTTYKGGSPGIGFYIQNGSASTNADFGFSSFMASDSLTTDDTLPSTPANLTATAISSSQINLSWTASTDNVGVAGYSVYRNGQETATTTSTNFSDTTAAPGTQYTYVVAAFDAAGNMSAHSLPATATTPSTIDVMPPSVPAGLNSSNITATALTISWSASTDNVAVTGYQIFRNGIEVATTLATSYSDTGLAPSTIYTYTIAGYDSSNNLSAQSHPLIIKTTAPPLTPPSLIQVSQNQISSGSATSAAFNAPLRAGSTIVVYVIWNNIGTLSLTDSRSNTFVNVGNPLTWGNGNSAQVFYATNIGAGADTVTAAFRNSVTSFGIVYIHEYAGISTTNPVDVAVSASGSSGLLNSGSATTTSINDLIFGAGVSDNAITAAGSGFTARDLAFGNMTEDHIAGSIGSYGATATQNGRVWGMEMVAFRAAN